MRTKVKSFWGAGFVSVSTPYVKKALENKEDLEIQCGDIAITVPYEKLKEKKPRHQGFDDKFGRRKSYDLYDFFWKDYL